MFSGIKKLFDVNEKEIKRLAKLVEKINGLESKYLDLKDGQIAEETARFKDRLAKGEMPDDLLFEAFALVREAAKRVIGERHYDAQMMAALTLHRGAVAEQKTGEGKTLSSIPALYLNALTGRGAHLVTVNDYLAKRDCGWMGPVFNLLGLSVSAIVHDQSFMYDPGFADNSVTDWRLINLKPISRKDAYLADITYGINSEFGFDYLRDNMVSEKSQMVQRGFHYAVVDEVDSVLIDEARTPHIISAPDSEPTSKYYEYAKIVERISKDTDFSIDEKLRTAHLTENGITKVEQMLGVDNLYEKDFLTVHHIEAALKARALFSKDKDYVVKDNEIIIVDEFTGRLLQGRRFSEGLHQAIEAKEGVSIQQESRTLATVSLQNYFRMYQKLSGMTGTASTEAEEFHKIYKLDVIIIPTNSPLIRKDSADVVYKNSRGKFAAVVEEINTRYQAGQPVLVGTTSINKNEHLSDLLRRRGVPHALLNAKNHEKEAQIIAEAGKKGAVTVATNMAGRGVDIVLGGMPPNKYLIDSAANRKEYEKLKNEWKKKHDEVTSLGGLCVIGTERHESRRIDNQLRGRAGRQGDPGTSKFFVSLDDEVMRLFGGDQVARLMTAFKMPEDVPLEHGMVSKAIEQAQVKVEGFNFDIRKHLVEYDDVLNKQREIVYSLRKKIVGQESLKEMILEKLDKQINLMVDMHAYSGITGNESKSILDSFIAILPFDSDSQNRFLSRMQDEKTPESLKAFLKNTVVKAYEKREADLGPQIARQIERWVYLSTVDNYWMGHLDAIDDLREGIGLRGYGQLDPLVEYKNEAFNMFERLLIGIEREVAARIFKVQVQLAPDQMQAIKQQSETPIEKSAKTERAKEIKNTPAAGKKLGRNDPCWCGSEKKWKRCHYPQIS